MRNGARPRRMPNALTSTYLAAKTARSPAISARIPAISPATPAIVTTSVARSYFAIQGTSPRALLTAARIPAISATIPATSPARSATVAAGSRLAARPISCAWGHRRPGWRSPATFPARPFIRSLGAPTQTTPDFPQSATSTKTRLRQKRQDLRQDRQASQHRPLCTSQKREYPHFRRTPHRTAARFPAKRGKESHGRSSPHCPAPRPMVYSVCLTLVNTKGPLDETGAGKRWDVSPYHT